VKAETLVQSFLIWLEGDVPSVHATLAPPATAKSLAKLARKWGELPGDFLELYRMHDGQIGEEVEFLPSYNLMPIADIVRWRSDFEELEEDLDEDEAVWDDAWIPFAQLPVYLQFLCLHAKTGEVVAYDHKGCDSCVIARSFGELLTRIRVAVKQRQFVVTKRGIAPHAKHANWMRTWSQACEPSKPRKRKAKKPKRRRPRSQ
jgi:cell wall assembly regulator SMI1